MWTVPLGHQNTQPDHSPRPSTACYSPEHKRMDSSTVGNANWWEISFFSLFLLITLDAHMVAVCVATVRAFPFAGRIVRVRGRQHVCAHATQNGMGLDDCTWAQRAERARWRDGGQPGWNGRVIGWDEKWESLTLCYLQGWLMAREPIQSPHPCATPSTIKILNYREERQERWR